MSRQTLYDKIWAMHSVAFGDESLLYIDLHLLHEISTPQAFAGLRDSGLPVRCPEKSLAVFDHNVPTENQAAGVAEVADPAARLQLAALESNTARTGIEAYRMGDARNGIVHVVGPEQGRTLPGMTIVCGDSHTSTHGAFGALAYGIGTSQVEHVLATQTLRAQKSGCMRVSFEGKMPEGVSAKDMALALIAQIGTGGATGYVIEYAGAAVRSLSMEGRMTLCNMTIEAGARAGLIAPDQTTFDYLQGRPAAPQGAQWEQAVSFWRQLASDPDAVFERDVLIDVSTLAPMVSWGTSPQQSLPITGIIPSPDALSDPEMREAARRACDYMGIEPGAPIHGTPVQRVFIGSCTNSRIEDLRAAAAIVEGRHVAPGVSAMVVPGSGLVKLKAESEGLDRIFRDAGFEWREPGCSMCLGMNPDRLAPGERCASTSNRNFEGRQGPGGRTHLCSPEMAAAAAITGCLTDSRELRR